MEQRSKLFGFKVISILDGKGRGVLQRVLAWGTPGKSPSITLDAYLSSLPEDSTASYRYTKIKFNKSEINQLRQCSSCSQCDITLLFKAIKLACENVASFEDRRWVEPSKELEYYLTCIKNKRNEVFHGHREMSHPEFLRTAADIRELLVATLTAAGHRYDKTEREVTKEIEGVHSEIDRIMEEVLGEEELLMEKGDMLTKDFIEEADRRVRLMLEETVYLDPMSFLSGTTLRSHVESIFCRIKIKQSQPGHKEGNVEYADILTLVQGSETPTSEETRQSSPPTPAKYRTTLNFQCIASSAIRRFFKKKPVQQKVPTPSQQTRTSMGRPQLLLVQGVAGSGKTTLLSLIMAEYMKTVGDRILRGLDQYDLLLRVQCRDHHSSSFGGLLQQLMPDQFLKYRNILLPLLKRCRVLVLIDGLDEVNNNSSKLVKDILHEAKNARGFTLVCTSRPEKVTDFLPTIPSEYIVIRMELTGIPESERLSFVLRHHRLITQQVPGCRSSADDLQQIINEIGAREQFRLPLNLLFLTWIFSHDPSFSASTITQSELYFRIHELCQQRLLDRLSRSANAMDRWTLQKKLQEVVQELYRVCVVGLSRCQLSLSKEDEDSLRSACIARGLPHQEVLSAFLTLKATWSPWGIQEQYSPPHKGLQDFYGALYVVPLVGKGNAKSIKDKILGSGKVDLSVFQYMLRHVAALLPHPVKEDAADQVVNLLKTAGMRYEDHWLDLIEDTKAAPAIVVSVAQHFPVPEDIMIKDTHVKSYTALLPHLPPSRVGIVLNRDPRDVMELFEALSGHACTRLYFRHHFRYPRITDTSDAILQQVLASNKLEDFGGHLSEIGVAELPSCLKKLSLAVVGDDHARRILLAIQDQPTRLPLLHNLEIHVPLASLSSTTLPQLPDAGDVMVYLSSVTDYNIPKACQVAGALQPPSGYMGISFPKVGVTVDGWKKLLDGLEQQKVKTVGLEAPAACLPSELRIQLREQAKKTLSAYFFR
ncbi:hypothetical protein E2C01_050610 [Portunus trituberculatus]|uniref:NACHT domain-containing protein n=1 Tax=Portunus trituberculatus TaxID=210409 RepID=A0A5B7GGV4_PORTR|nr:hypothetical protein [Portunus trituberculatus]